MCLTPDMVDNISIICLKNERISVSQKHDNALISAFPSFRPLLILKVCTDSQRLKNMGFYVNHSILLAPKAIREKQFCTCFQFVCILKKDSHYDFPVGLERHMEKSKGRHPWLNGYMVYRLHWYMVS